MANAVRAITRRVSAAMKNARRGCSVSADSIEYRIGGHTLRMPADHALPRYQASWPLYDHYLSLFTEVLSQHSDDLTIIDIGANVGDSASALLSTMDIPLLCIEGDPEYLPYLKENAARLGAHVIVEECYVGDRTSVLDANALQRCAGTTTAASSLLLSPDQPEPNDRDAHIRVERLESILQKHTRFAKPRLIKIDTDGFDFSIMASHASLLASIRPVLYFEYMVNTPDAASRATDCIDSLAKAGYQHFMIFDNFGNMVGVKSAADLADMNWYLLSNAAYSKAVFYFDVLAVVGADKHVIDAISSRIRAGITRQLRSACSC